MIQIHLILPVMIAKPIATLPMVTDVVSQLAGFSFQFLSSFVSRVYDIREVIKTLAKEIPVFVQFPF